MDTKFLESWSTKLNVSAKKLKDDFEKAKQEMQSLFPSQKEEIIFEKAKLKLKVDYKRSFMSSAVPFVGIVVANESPRDPLVNIRAKQLEIYEKAKQKSAETGDAKIVDNIVKRGIVRIAEGVVIPLWPKLKKDGQPNKLAGKDLPQPADSQMQVVYGIGTPFGKEEPKGFVLELRGRACNQEFYKGKIVSFKAIDKSEKNSAIYKLSTNQTDFIETEDKHMQEGINKLGITGLVEHFFKNKIATWQEMNDWVIQKKNNPQANPIPEKYNDIMVIPQSMCVYQNFNTDAKGRIKISLCGISDDIQDITMLCLADASLEKSIDFAQNSKVVAIGRPWLPPANDRGEVTMILMTSGMYAYPDWKVPRVNAKKVGEKEILQEEKPAAPVEVAKEKPEESNKAW